MKHCMESFADGLDDTDGMEHRYWCDLEKGHEGPHEAGFSVEDIFFPDGEPVFKTFRVRVIWEEVKYE